ncbi:MAG: hypothetical protein CSB44_08370 [Gammaproteobacteria bacterium]|nr:MAG: hypothetical protein CSB44_08370 [Gammaproteobacteria bacterium]PIE37312.1 MAG: hypothetical protein CSA54_01615 [Gammaproteobacteria bacterium]
MSDFLESRQRALSDWTDKAIDAGWLHAQARDELAAVVVANPGDLFEIGQRPLVAGLFGGTGVGKSTLLNRLAREPVARASAERPTSRDITVYVHRSVNVDRLPEELPLARMRTSLHQRAEYRNVLWVDMPDFDSIESSHRELVDLWLPHLDVVLYVVSPDRYRDDRGWRLLLEHGNRHAWLFVFNHWDRGHPEQIDDFRQLLRSAGLDDPMIFRCDNAETGRDDDFAELENTLQSLAETSLIESLDRHGVFQRLDSLHAVSVPWVRPLEHTGEAGLALWEEHWRGSTANLDAESRWKIPAIALRHAPHRQSLLSRWWPRRLPGVPNIALPGADETTSAPAATTSPDASTLIDAAALQRVDESIERFGYRLAEETGLPHAAVRRHLAPLSTSLPGELERLAALELNAALAAPGSRWQRLLHRMLSLLALLLPLAALTWVAVRVIAAFNAGADDPNAYLGSNFAVNGVLMILLAWLIPTFLAWRARPSLERAAALGLEQGLKAATDRVDVTVRAALADMSTEAAELASEYRALWDGRSEPDGGDVPERLKRLLMRQTLGSPVHATG